MACAEANSLWSKFTAFVYAHTVILLTIGLALGSNGDRYRGLATTLAVLGWALCVGWYFLNRLSFAWFAYWVKAARALEAELGEDLTFQRGDSLSKGKTITLRYQAGVQEAFTLPRGPKVRAVSGFVIASFALVYAVVVIWLWRAA